jgi:hypothetical protein
VVKEVPFSRQVDLNSRGLRSTPARLSRSPLFYASDGPFSLIVDRRGLVVYRHLRATVLKAAQRTFTYGSSRVTWSDDSISRSGSIKLHAYLDATGARGTWTVRHAPSFGEGDPGVLAMHTSNRVFFAIPARQAPDPNGVLAPASYRLWSARWPS